MRYLFAHAGGERVAVPAAAVVEVVPAVRLQPAAGSPGWVPGVFRFRGAIVPVVDLGQLTAGNPCPERLNTRIVVLRAADGRLLGLRVERVSELADLTADGSACTAGASDLGPLVADPDGVVRLPDVDHLLTLGYGAG